MDRGSRIPTYLVTGFLGAGKTTWLNQLIRQLTGLEQTLAVLMNEFGATGVDGALVEGYGHLSELNKGSIFCICVRDDFLAEMERVAKDVKPDVMVIEATGIADPLELSSFIDAVQLRDYYELVSTTAIVDPLTFPKLVDVVRAVPRQVQAADFIVLNKSDTVDAKYLDQVRQLLQSINPAADIFTTSFGRLGSTTWQEIIAGRQRFVPTETDEPTEFARDPMLSQRIAVGPFADTSAVAEFVRRFPAKVLRAKGFIEVDDEPKLLQYVAGQWSLSGFSGDRARISLGILVVIGHLLSVEDLTQAGFSVVQEPVE